MLKWLMKFAVEIAPPVAATVIGAFVVHQLWPSQQPDARSAAVPPAVHAPVEHAKPASLSTGNSEADGAGASVTATIPPSTGTGKSPRQSSEVAKTVPTTPSTPRGETAASVLERAEKALAAIPSAKARVPSATAPSTQATSVAPPPVVTTDTPTITTTNTAAVTIAPPPPIDPPREIGSLPQVTRQVQPPAQSSEPARSRDRSPLRVYRNDRANLADIPSSEDDDAVTTQQAASAPPEPAPASPPREKNIVEHIFGPLHSILPERLR